MKVRQRKRPVRDERRAEYRRALRAMANSVGALCRTPRVKWFSLSLETIGA